MDNAKVTTCDETTALSQSTYDLFYAREGGWEGDAGRGALAPSGLTPQTPGSLQETPAAELLGQRSPRRTQRSKG